MSLEVEEWTSWSIRQRRARAPDSDGFLGWEIHGATYRGFPNDHEEVIRVLVDNQP